MFLIASDSHKYQNCFQITSPPIGEKCVNQPPVCPLAKTGKLVAVVGFQRGRVREACCRGVVGQEGKGEISQSPPISQNILTHTFVCTARGHASTDDNACPPSEISRPVSSRHGIP